MAQNYDIKQFSSEELKINGKIVIPTYQRGLVWKTSKRKEFIDTIFKGNPFGVVLVYEKNDKYEVVDGLQRLSTMKAYMDNPLDFISVNDEIPGEDLLDIIIKKKLENSGRRANPTQIQSGKKTLKRKMLQYVKEKGKPKAADVFKFLSEEIGFNENDFECMKNFTEYYDNFLEKLKFPIILIPAIVYTGPYDDLPDVFQRLNTGSVKLTKYEIFASIWKENLLLIKDADIIDKVMEKYTKLEDTSSFDVNVSESDLTDNGISFFEYCYAVSEILNDEEKDYGCLFPGEKKSTDPTGFELLALVSGLSVNKSNKLVEPDYLGQKSPQFLIELKNALVDCVSFLYSALKDWITDLKGTVINNESTYQMYHMVVSIFKNTYDLDTKNGTITRKDEAGIVEWRKLFKKYAYKNYLYDILTQFWSSHRQVSDLDDLIKDANQLNKYTTQVSRENIQSAFNEYCADIKSKAFKRTIESASKLFMNYYYKMLINEDKNRETYFKKDDGTVFDIEHIVPVAKFDDKKEELPMSSIGNLCYLPVKDNRSKRDKTIYQYADDRPSLTFDPTFLSIIDYPKRQELEFLDYSDEEFKNSFTTFVTSREERIIAKFVELFMK